MTYPTTFSDTVTELTADLLDEPGKAALEKLHNAGFIVTVGVTQADVPAITAIAQQEGVREFAPKDATHRFADEAMMRQWLTKDGGRGMFLLRRGGSQEVVGYGWSGAAVEAALPECQTTFAIRLSKQVAGQGLAAPFARVIITGSIRLFEARNIWLETWGSNTGAVRTYLKAGAVLVTTKDATRPTLSPLPTETDGLRRDVRVYMKFPYSFVD